MGSDALYGTADEEMGEPGMFLELGINRLARDLFLLTAVCALFIAMFMSSVFRIVANRSWAREARVVEEEEPAARGVILAVHVRRDGRIQVGKNLVSTPEEAVALVQELIRHAPATRNATVVMNTYRNTPSIRTSDVAAALASAGLDQKRFYLRFTEE